MHGSFFFLFFFNSPLLRYLWVFSATGLLKSRNFFPPRVCLSNARTKPALINKYGLELPR